MSIDPPQQSALAAVISGARERRNAIGNRPDGRELGSLYGAGLLADLMRDRALHYPCPAKRADSPLCLREVLPHNSPRLGTPAFFACCAALKSGSGPPPAPSGP